MVAFAAIAVPAQDDYHKWEVYGGFLWGHYDNAIKAIDDGIDNKNSVHGFNGEFTYNFHRYVGATFDFSSAGQTRTFSDPTVNLSVRYRQNQFYGGVQLKDNAKGGSRWRPFAHVLIGFADQRWDSNGFVTGVSRINLVDSKLKSQDVSMVFGGGLDIKVHPRIDIRAIQFDYNPVYFGTKTYNTFVLPNGTQNNFRTSFGVVFH